MRECARRDGTPAKDLLSLALMSSACAGMLLTSEMQALRYTSFPSMSPVGGSLPATWSTSSWAFFRTSGKAAKQHIRLKKVAAVVSAAAPMAVWPMYPSSKSANLRSGLTTPGVFCSRNSLAMRPSTRAEAGSPLISSYCFFPAKKNAIALLLTSLLTRRASFFHPANTSGTYLRMGK